jgi:DNA-binding MarR family transcriptional regulator
MPKKSPAPAEEAFDLATFLPYKLSAVSRLTQGLLASALGESGVTVAHWRVYLCLVRRGPSHLNGIAEFTRLPQSSLSRSIAQMADKGLVRSARNESDRRIARIELTAAGRKYFEQVTARMSLACEQVFQMQPAEEALFLKTIDDLITRLSTWLGVDPAGPDLEQEAAGPPARRSHPR